MKSNKQRKAEILARRAARAAKALALERGAARKEILTGTAPCNPESLAPYNSYGCPPFVERGYYVDILFQCRDCQKQEVWRATQQKWWYEVAKGNVESGAIRCNACRRKERERKAEARRVHQEGLAAKKQVKCCGQIRQRWSSRAGRETGNRARIGPAAESEMLGGRVP